jgi:hypothetical protein
MHFNFPARKFALPLSLISILCDHALPAKADSTELEVYRDDIAEKGESNFDFSANAVRTARQSDFDGGTVFQAVGEFAYGLDDEWQIGLKLPLSYLAGTWKADGLLSEIKYVAPHDKTGWYFGAEFEIGYESSITEVQKWTIEAVPVIGLRSGKWDFTLNPGLSVASGGEQRGVIAFEPSAKVSYQVAGATALGLEYFSEAGPLRSMYPGRARNELAFLTVDTKVGKSIINFGIGRGTNGTSPGLAIKAVLDLEFD